MRYSPVFSVLPALMTISAPSKEATRGNVREAEHRTAEQSQQQDTPIKNIHLFKCMLYLKLCDTVQGRHRIQPKC